MVKWFQSNNVCVEKVSITGGEPLLHSELLDIIDELGNMANNIHLNTNGMLLTKELVDEFHARGIVLRVGIDSIDSNQTKPNLDEAMANRNSKNILDMIEYAASSGVHVIFSTVFSNFNRNNLDRLIEWAAKIGVKCVKIIKLNDFDSRGLNKKHDVEDDFKTNHLEASLFYDFRQKYVYKAWHCDEYTFLGKHRVFLRQEDESEFEVVFCDDLCTSGACANVYTAIDSKGELMICPKNHITTPIDFSEDYKVVSEVLLDTRNKKCDSYKNRFDLRDNINSQMKGDAINA